MKLFRLLLLAGIINSASVETNKNSSSDLDTVTRATEIVKPQNGLGGADSK